MNSPAFRVLSFAKVNLALTILGRRPDGFHEVRTVLQTVDLCDQLEFRPSRDLCLSCDGLDDLPREENLVWKAAGALASASGFSGGAEMVLHKRIPVGSGLGGGSSNAAATLLALNRMWGLDWERERLESLAGTLGSDVPFFLTGGTALGVGRGEEIYPLEELPQSAMVIVVPGVAVSTHDAYEMLSFSLTRNGNANRIRRFCSRIPEGSGCLAEIFNDFETSILPAYPEVREARDFLAQLGATAAHLSGSGSAVFGFFFDEESALAASRAAFRESWRVFPAKTLSRAEYLRRMFG